MLWYANVHKVQVKQWRKWSEHARAVFNGVFSTMYRNQTVFLHPEAEKAAHLHWRTTAWNAAWTAADATDENAPKKGDLVIDIEPETGREVRRHVMQ